MVFFAALCAGYSSIVPLLTKYLWRKGYLRVPDACSVETSGGGDESTCRTSCPSELYESQGMSPYDVLMDVKAVHWFAASTDGAVVSLVRKVTVVLETTSTFTGACYHIDACYNMDS